MTRVVLISYTPASWNGGVNKVVRDLLNVFPGSRHFSFWDYPYAGNHPNLDLMSEQRKAWLLAHSLDQRALIKKDDVIIADGFWCGELLARGYKNVISHSHGIWGHVTSEDLKTGKRPENPELHAAQVAHRLEHQRLGGRNVAVSQFIADEMEKQIGVKSMVIDNGVDTDVWKPRGQKQKGLIVHPVNDPGNVNKGWDHIALLKQELPWDYEVLSLDEASLKLSCTKPEALAQAELFVAPSGFEGNSMAVLEALASDVPVVGYDVGLLYQARQEGRHGVGMVGLRRDRCPAYTLTMVQDALVCVPECFLPRQFAERFSLDVFANKWRAYVASVTGDHCQRAPVDAGDLMTASGPGHQPGSHEEHPTDGRAS